MCCKKKERFKSYILLILILTSFIQVGILWDYQNHGLPINFLSGIFGNAGLAFSDADDAAREGFFVPYRISVSNGDESHWVISRNDDLYRRLWDEAKEYLRDVLASRQAQQSMASDEWGNLVIKKVFVFEFKFNIKYDLLKWFLNAPGTQAAESRGLYKMVISPGENVNENKITIYILDDAGIRVYAVPLRKNGMSYRDYENIISKLEQAKDREFKEYTLAQELRLTGKFAISPDVLCVVKGSEYKFREYWNISFGVPEKLSNLDEVAHAVLGSEKDSYDRYTDIHKTIVFKNLDNIYRVYSDGLLEYKYIPGPEGVEKGDMSAAFVNAARFVNRARQLLDSKAGIYISRVEVKQDVYQFIFDYKIGDYPIFMDYGPRGKDREPVKNAIVIEANSKRIIKSRWILKNFEQTNDKDKYNVNIGDLMAGTDLKNFNELFINDMGVSYVISKDADKSLKPVWIIERDGGNNVVIPMHK